MTLEELESSLREDIERHAIDWVSSKVDNHTTVAGLSLERLEVAVKRFWAIEYYREQTRGVMERLQETTES